MFNQFDSYFHVELPFSTSRRRPSVGGLTRSNIYGYLNILLVKRVDGSTIRYAVGERTYLTKVEPSTLKWSR